jgi:two-component system sensor histidine kinase BaeS
MPRLTLQRKVFFALAALLVALLLIFAGFTRFGLQRGLGPYVAEIELSRMQWVGERAEQNYARNGNWDALRDGGHPYAWHQLLHDYTQSPPRTRPLFRSGSGMGFGPSGPPSDDFWPSRRDMPAPTAEGENASDGSSFRPPRFGGPPPLPFEFDRRPNPDSIYARLGVTDARGVRVAGAPIDAASAVRRPLRRAGETIGYLVLAPLEDLGSDADRAFLAQQSRFMVWTGLVGLALALALSWLLARHWFAPIGELMDSARGIAQGRLGTRVRVQGQDELATLARTFNHMAARLDRVESSRRAWLADVAHELRTPLAAMRAEIEALQDGVRTFDDRTALRLHRQVMRLGQLVDDLRLSMSDTAVPLETAETVRPLALIDEAAASMRERFAQAGIALETTWPPATAGRDASASASAPEVIGDARRLHQVVMNLLENSLRYTDAGGRLRVSRAPPEETPPGELLLWFDDTAPGVDEAERPLIFERLYRCEGSRDRMLGGSGLGLAICRSVVLAHGGRIEADHSPLGGLRIALTLPLTEDLP